jgi:hypothetical protein
MADLKCAKCNKVVEEQNAVECPFCWEVYHKKCWEDTENCVTCKKYNPIYEMAQAQKEHEVENEKEEECTSHTKENIIEDEPLPRVNVKEMLSSPAANTVFLASLVVLASSVAGGIAFLIYMYFVGKIIVGIIGGLAICGLGFALSLIVKGVAEMVNNSQKTAYYLSKLVRMVEEEE